MCYSAGNACLRKFYFFLGLRLGSGCCTYSIHLSFVCMWHLLHILINEASLYTFPHSEL